MEGTMAQSYAMLARYLERADEVSRMPEVPAPIARLYTDRLAPRAEAFRAAAAALIDAEASATKERREVDSAVARIAAPYKLARSIVRARMSELAVPENLGSLATDTDKKLAIGELLEGIERSSGEPWADEILAGDFGRLAPEAIREIDEGVLASASRKAAADARAAAAGPAYEEYLSFKAAVLAGMGRRSAAYQRLARRVHSGAGDEPAPAVEEPADESA
jgi:hypothetical protein